MSHRHSAAKSFGDLLLKLGDQDPDIRFMSLSDLQTTLGNQGASIVTTDAGVAGRVFDGLLKGLIDSNGEVQNEALKCMAPFAKRIPGDYINTVIEKLVALTNAYEIDVAIPNTALRTIISSLPQPQPAGPTQPEVKMVYASISKVLIPRLVGQQGLLQWKEPRGYSPDAVEVMIEVVRCYGALLHDQELALLTTPVIHIVENPKAGTIVKKRALAAIGTLIPHFGPQRLESFVSVLLNAFSKGPSTPDHQKYLVAAIGTMARAVPARAAQYISSLSPSVLHVVSEAEYPHAEDSDAEQASQDVEDLRESALATLDAMIASCGAGDLVFVEEAIDAALRYLKYNPNLAQQDDGQLGDSGDLGSDDGQTEDLEEDEDDEFADLDGDDAFSDDDDQSWKIRRCAAKTLHTAISAVYLTDSAVLYGKIAPSIIANLHSETDDNVKIEILLAMSALIKKTGQDALFTRQSQKEGKADLQTAAPSSRKRRRQDSDASLDSLDMSAFQQSSSSPIVIPSSPVGHQTDLAEVTPKLIQSLVKTWKKATIPLKQTGIELLRYLALTRNGAITNYLQQIEGLISDSLKPTGSSSVSGISTASATAASLQVDTLVLISVIAETTPTEPLLPFVIALLPDVTKTLHSLNFKVAGEGLGALEQFIKALTPPRNKDRDVSIQLEKIFEVVSDRILDNKADLEIRRHSIHVFTVLLARDQSSRQVLKPALQAKGFEMLRVRLSNETTRLATARALSVVGPTFNQGKEWVPAWVRSVSLELGSHLRKADRALRTACLAALKCLALNTVTAARYDEATIQQLTGLLLPLLGESELHTLTSTLIIFARMVPTNPTKIVNQDVIAALSAITTTTLTGSALKALLMLVKVIGEQQIGEQLMKRLLSVGVNGDLSVVGRCIGTLLAYGGSSLGITSSDFESELRTAVDDRNKCLALVILGEVGLRQGGNIRLEPSTFMKSLESGSDRVRVAAAVALGSAGASNLSEYMPIILGSMGESTASDYLFLQAIKEILQHQEFILPKLSPHLKEIWQKLFLASVTEDTLAVGAECIGRLAMIDPPTYLPDLQIHLQDNDPLVRGAVMTAFRFTLGNTSEAYNALMPTYMVPLLLVMLKDKDLANRRLAFTTLNSAIHNKPDLIVLHLPELLPAIMPETHINPSLIRMVNFGPFKIPVDDGLDLRRTAYETLYALLETPSAIPKISLSTIWERILDGIPDDNDIRTLCHLMISKLVAIDSAETLRRLPALANKFRGVLLEKPKENAVKQELEKLAEANAAVVRSSLELDGRFHTQMQTLSASGGGVGGGAGAGAGAETMAGQEWGVWKAYLDWLKKDFHTLVRMVQDEGGL